MAVGVWLVVLTLLLLAGVLGCAALSESAAQPDTPNPRASIATSPTTFGVCKALDVASTMYIVQNGIGYETNPWMAALMEHGFLPLVAVSYGVYWWINQFSDPTTTLIANAITCPVALHNLTLIR